MMQWTGKTPLPGGSRPARLHYPQKDAHIVRLAIGDYDIKQAVVIQVSYGHRNWPSPGLPLLCRPPGDCLGAVLS